MPVGWVRRHLPWTTPTSWAAIDDIKRALLVASLYAGFATAGYRLSHLYSLGVSVFPAAGVSLAGLLLSPRRSWPWILTFVWFVEVGLDLFHGSGPVLAVTFAVGNTVEPVMSALIIGAICGPNFSLERVRDILTLAFAGCISPMVSAAIAAAGASAEGLSDFRTWWSHWWAGDVVGGLAVAAALVAWRSHSTRPRLRPRTIAFLCGGGVVGTAAFLVGGDRIPIAFLIAPVLVVIAVRAGATGVGFAAFGLVVLGEYSAWAHIGPLAGSYSRSETIGLTQVFVGTSLFTMLVLHAASAQGDALQIQSKEKESIGSVAKEVAHDVNHLLALILVNCEILSMELGPQGAQWDALERIVQGAERTSKIVRQLQIVSSPFDGAARADLNIVIRSMELLLRTAAGHSSLKLALSATPCEVRVGGSAVEQVLLNLVLNAREATHDGSILVTTHVSREGPEESWRAVLRVVDDGSGMDEQMIIRALDGWFTNTHERTRGVGLPRVRGIVEPLGGTVDIKSRLGAGTAVSVSWPLDLSGFAWSGPPAVQDALPAVIGEATSPTLLVVVSDQALRTQLVSGLSDQGYRLAVVAEAAATLTLSRSLDRVDAAIIQAALMGLNGIALARRLIVERPDLPIMLLGDLSSLPGRTLPDRAAWIPMPPDEAVLLRWVSAVAPAAGGHVPEVRRPVVIPAD
jgi:signal transduction histidine kinase